MAKLTPWFWLLARIFLGAVFVFAGYIKLTASVQDFHANVLEYGVIPYNLAYVVALILPWIEVFAGVFLIVGYIPRLSAMVLGGLAISFVILIGSSFFKYGELPTTCGCFGDSLRLTFPQLITLDVINFFIGVKLFFLKEHKLSLDSWLRKN